MHSIWANNQLIMNQWMNEWMNEWKSEVDFSQLFIRLISFHSFSEIKSSLISSLYGQSYGFSSSHVWMWELDTKKGWVPKNRCFGMVVLEKTLESPLDCKEIQLVHPKGNQS